MFVVLLLCFAVGINAQQPLGVYDVDANQISTSGLSSGAAMATQFHVAFSSTIMGAALVAGMPYWCAKGSITTATTACMVMPSMVNVGDLIAQTDKYATAGDIDPTADMANDKVWLFAGTADTTVNPGLGALAEEYYQNYMNAANIATVFDMRAAHTHPTLDYGNACTISASPYVSKCDYDGSYELLNHIYGGVLTKPPTGTVQAGDFYEFDQSEFFDNGNPSASMMDDTGYVYVPTGCLAKKKRTHSLKGKIAACNANGARVECGNSGSTSETCTADSCCWDESVPGVPFCFFPEADVCSAAPADRVDCGMSGTTSETCLADGCCWDGTVPGYPFCFFKADAPACSAAPADRVDCGMSGTTSETCLADGCCWDNTVPGYPSCFFQDGTSEPPTGACRLHVVFHGCLQGAYKIGDEYARNGGYNEVGEVNNIIMLYPQAISNIISNPNGCWDWWGYNAANYATKAGEQQDACYRMIQKMASLP